ncbi:MAG: PilZ domain-containing protein [Hyphomicrobiaceae bacterium]
MIQKLITERRKHSRQTTWQAVKVVVDNTVYVCDVIQISNSGAALELAQNLDVQHRQKVKLVFINGTEVAARIVWVNSRKCGVSFDINFLSHSDLHHYEYMGYELYRQMVKTQKLRATDS